MSQSMQITSESIKDQIPYYLSQKAKEHLVKALDNFPRQIDYYISLYPNETLQGDGWNSVDVIRFEDGARKLIKGLLLSNSCDIAPENKRDLPTKLSFASMVKLNCQVPCDHIPVRSWPFFRARALLQAVIASFKAEQHP